MRVYYNTDVRKLMLDCGLNQSGLADLLGVSQAAVSQRLAKPLDNEAKTAYMDALRAYYASYIYLRDRKARTL